MADNDWIEWAGGECPVDPETRVDVRARDGRTNINDVTAGFYSIGQFDWWKHESPDHNNDIVAYRVVPA